MSKLLLVCLSVLLLVSCKNERMKYPHVNVNQCLDAAMESGERLSFSGCLDIEWDHVLILKPGDDVDVIAQTYGVAIPDRVRATGVGSREGLSVLVFVSDNRFAAFSSVPRAIMDFSSVERALIPARELNLRAERDPEGGWPVAVAGDE